SHEQLLGLVYAEIEDINRRLEPQARLRLAPGTFLYGERGHLDSLALVELLVGTEQRLADEFGGIVTLAGEHAFARARSPFRSVSALVEYIAERLEGEHE